MGAPTCGSRHAWEDAGAFPVAPGVHRIPLPLPGDVLRAVNVYALEDAEGITLVDAGQHLPVARRQLVAGLEVLGAGLSDVRRFLVTHVHRDHYSQAIALRREFGTRVSLGRDEAPSLRLLRDPARRPIQTQFEMLEICGAEPLCRELEREPLNEPQSDLYADLYADPDDWLDESSGDLAFGRLRAVPTPGHTRGHVCFVDRHAGLFFAGEHVLPHVTPSIGFEPAAVELPLRDYLASLRRVRELPDAVLLPAHGPVASSTHQRVDELIGHHDSRLAATLLAVGDATRTPYNVAQTLRWTRHERVLSELDAFNQMLATLECKAHLDLLVAQERLERTEAGGILHYGRREAC